MLHRIREDLEFFLHLRKEGGHSCPPPPLKGEGQDDGCNTIQVLPLPELPVETDQGSVASDRQLDQIGTLSRLANSVDFRPLGQ